MKKLLKNPLFYFAAVFVLGGAVAVAKVMDCGTVCTAVISTIDQFSADIAKARAEQSAPVATVTPTSVL